MSPRANYKASPAKIEAAAERHNEILKQLDSELGKLGESEGWLRWLDVQRRFHSYSWGNALLIVLQCPDATRVAGFKTWLSLNRAVRKGEKSIRILAPMTFKCKACEFAQAGETCGKCGGNGSRTMFRDVGVFDISQTDGEELPADQVVRLIGGDDGGLFDRLRALAVSRGISVELVERTGSANGDYTPAKNRIRVSDDMAPAMRAKTLAHEISHSIMHPGGYSETERSIAELEAESAAYVVCGSLGLDTSAYSLGYVAHWQGGTDEARKQLKASLTRIQKAAAEILSGISVDRFQEVAA